MAGFYTYLHKRADDGQVFYVGKGSGQRAWVTQTRSAWWRRTVAKHGLEVVIASPWATEVEAFEHEKLLIECLRELKAPLVNLTDGGEGSVGRRDSEEVRRRRAAASTGWKHTEAARAKLRAAWVSRKARGFSEATRAKLSASLTGRAVSEQTRKKLSETHRARSPKIEADGLALCVADWADRLGVAKVTVHQRLKRGLTPAGAPRTEQ